MANRTRLKGVKKNRHNLAAGRRCRSKRKKSVAEKSRLNQDTLLNSYYNEQQINGGFRCVK